MLIDHGVDDKPSRMFQSRKENRWKSDGEYNLADFFSLIFVSKTLVSKSIGEHLLLLTLYAMLAGLNILQGLYTNDLLNLFESCMLYAQIKVLELYVI